MSCALQHLRDIPIFSSLDDSVLDKISSICSHKFYKKDNIILYEKDPGASLFIIITGEVKISRESEEGKEVILSILRETDIFGEISLLDGLPRSANAIATEDTELYLLQRNDFLNMILKYPEVAIDLLAEIAKRLREAGMRIKSLSLNDAEGKVASVIIQLANDSGTIKNGVVEIEKLPFQHDLASMAGTSRETISRTLHSFAKKELVELEGSKLRIMNYEKFKEMFG